MKNLLIILAFCFLFCSVSIFSAFGGGIGTATDPYLITMREHLIELRDSVDRGNYWSKDKHFKVMNDITDSVRTMIGRNYGFPRETAFQGIFDGNGKKITLAIDTSRGGGGYGISLFNTVGESGVVKDVIVDGYVIGRDGDVAGIVGELYGGVVERCINNASLHSDGLCVGGIAGHNNSGIIRDCINSGLVHKYSNS